MSHQVYARRWRPQSLNTVVGQPAVVETLKQSFKTGTIAHAYLLTGTRGVGKTTLGRIVAKTAQCEHFPIEEACGQCASCKAHQNNCHPDLYEIDAASKTKVEDTRQLLEHAHYAPNLAKKKVYLIDEVHMLSTHSFNALLKTLEEPPAHIMFILATTEIQRLPTTIVSRCLHLSLRALEHDKIVEMMSTILAHEKIQCDDGALALLAEQANGSMRDGLTLLEQVSRRFHDGMTLDRVQAWIGSTPKALLNNITNAICENSQSDLYKQIELLQQQQLQPNVMLQQLVQYWHEQCLQAFNQNALDKAARMISLFDTTVHGIKQLEFVSDPWIVVRMTLLRCLTPRNNNQQPVEVVDTRAKEKATTTPAETDAHQVIASIQASGMLRRALDGLTFDQRKPNTAFYTQKNESMYTEAMQIKIRAALKNSSLNITEFKQLSEASADNSLNQKRQVEKAHEHKASIEHLSKNTDIKDLMKSLDSALADSIITDNKS